MVLYVASTILCSVSESLPTSLPRAEVLLGVSVEGTGNGVPPCGSPRKGLKS